MSKHRKVSAFLMKLKCVFFFIRENDDWLVVLFYGVSTLFRSFKAKLSHFNKSFKQFSLVKVQFFFCSYTVTC